MYFDFFLSMQARLLFAGSVLKILQTAPDDTLNKIHSSGVPHEMSTVVVGSRTEVPNADKNKIHR